MAEDSSPKIVNLDGSPYEPPAKVEIVDDEIGLTALVARILAGIGETKAVLCVIRMKDDMEYMDGTEMLTDTQKSLAVSLMGMVQSRDVYLYDDEELEDDEADDND